MSKGAFFNSKLLSIYSSLEISYNVFSSMPNINNALFDIGEFILKFLFVKSTFSKLISFSEDSFDNLKYSLIIFFKFYIKFFLINF